MESATGHRVPSLGLAKNVPFRFDDLTLYLQVHVIREPGCDLLLGRPFDALCVSQINNSMDGCVIVMITDPISGRKVSIPTYDRSRQLAIIQRTKHLPEVDFQTASRS